MLQAEIPPNILRDARGVCGIHPSWQALYRSCKLCLSSPPPYEMTPREALCLHFLFLKSLTSLTVSFLFLHVLSPLSLSHTHTATLIMRENERVVHKAFSQMKTKIDQVREALVRQTRVLDETHQRLESLALRLTQMEEQGRLRDLERLRAREREEARKEDERWIREWEACQAQKMVHCPGGDGGGCV